MVGSPGAHVVEVAGRKVAHEPRPGAPLVMLVRLAARTAGLWDGLWPGLAREFAVANVELPAPSAADLAAPRDALMSLADDCVAVARALSHEAFHFVGWTGGTQIGLQAAARHPSSLASLTLLCPFFQLADMRRVERGLEIIEVLLRSGRRDLYTYYWYMSGLSEAFLARDFDPVDAFVRDRLAADPFVRLDVERALLWMRALRHSWLSAGELAALGMPALILAGGRNRWHVGPSREMAEALAARLRDAELGIFEEMGPLFPLEAPDGVLDRLIPFLRRHPPSR
ncbi:MAG: alpha/beta fold hydrolase [Geminicoccaceae bacterium]